MFRTIVFYALALVLAGAGLAWILHLGAPLQAPEPVGIERFGAGQIAKDTHTLARVLLALACILVTSRILGRIFLKFGQPRVVGEIAAGLLLGPSALGAISPTAMHWILPSQVAPHLALLSQVGVVLFMFLVGLELDPARLRSKVHSSIAVSHASIVLPFVLGAVLALYAYPRASTSDVPFSIFALFMGVSLSVTAFPVLARILNDRGMTHTPLGVLALTSAAVDDVTAWCLLALIVSLIRNQGEGAWVPAGLAVVYVLGMLLLVRPAVKWLACRWASYAERQATLAVAMGLLLVSAVITEAIGIHAIFGAFLAGAVVPAEAPAVRAIRSRVEDLVLVLLLPAFFAFTGMRTEIGLLADAESWVLCALVLLVAFAGKLGGSFAAAKLSGVSTADATRLGVLMNTRGLMELVVLNLGLDLRVLSPRLFTVLVVMAIVTTFATTPLLQLIDALERVRGRAPGNEARARAETAHATESESTLAP